MCSICLLNVTNQIITDGERIVFKKMSWHFLRLIMTQVIYLNHNSELNLSYQLKCYEGGPISGMFMEREMFCASLLYLTSQIELTSNLNLSFFFFQGGKKYSGPCGGRDCSGGCKCYPEKGGRVSLHPQSLSSLSFHLLASGHLLLSISVALKRKFSPQQHNKAADRTIQNSFFFLDVTHTCLRSSFHVLVSCMCHLLRSSR